MNTSIDEKVGDIVARDYRAASVFSKYGIDYCCGGQKSIEEACRKKEIEPEEIISVLDKTLTSSGQAGMNFNSWPMDLLTDYIEKTHHTYVKTKIPEITPLLYKLCKVHGKKFPFLFEVQTIFNQVSKELESHLRDEETLLFPLIRAKVSNPDLTIPVELKNSLKKMEAEHDLAGNAFKKIAVLTNRFTPPEGACTTHRVTYAMLKEFENDLHLHVHLENNILFPEFLKS